MLNFKITLPLAKLDVVGSRLVSNGLIFFRWYSGRYPVSNFFIVIQCSYLFFARSVSFFLVSTCFVLSEVTFLLILFSLLSKSVFFTKSTISVLVVKFACAYLAAKLSSVNLLNSYVVIYLTWSWSSIFFSTSAVFVL